MTALGSLRRGEVEGHLLVGKGKEGLGDLVPGPSRGRGAGSRTCMLRLLGARQASPRYGRPRGGPLRFLPDPRRPGTRGRRPRRGARAGSRIRGAFTPASGGGFFGRRASKPSRGSNEDMLRAPDASSNLSWFAGYATMTSAEFQRRRGLTDAALAAYGRAIEHFERWIASHPENRETADHYRGPDPGRAGPAWPTSARTTKRRSASCLASFRAETRRRGHSGQPEYLRGGHGQDGAPTA